MLRAWQNTGQTRCKFKPPTREEEKKENICGGKWTNANNNVGSSIERVLHTIKLMFPTAIRWLTGTWGHCANLAKGRRVMRFPDVNKVKITQ